MGVLPIGRLGVLQHAPPDLAEQPAGDRHESVVLAGRSLGSSLRHTKPAYIAASLFGIAPLIFRDLLQY